MKTTLIFAAACLAAVVIVVVTALAVKESSVETRSDVRSDVQKVLDGIEARIPNGIILSVREQVSQERCSSGGTMYRYVRSITTEGGFDRAKWIYALNTDVFSGEGYETRLRTLSSRDEVQLKVVDQRLLVTTITASSEDMVTLNLTSRCGRG